MQNFNLEQGFKSLFDLQFVGSRIHLKDHCVLLLVAAHSFFSNQWPSNNLIMLHVRQASRQFFPELLRHKLSQCNAIDRIHSILPQVIP